MKFFVKYEEAYTIKWEKDQIPVLQAVVSDFKYLKSQHIIYTISAIDSQNIEVLIGWIIILEILYIINLNILIFVYRTRVYFFARSN